MSPEPPKQPAETGLIIQREAGLVTLPNGGSPAMSEMINRSLVHLQTSKAIAEFDRRPGEEREFEIAYGVMMKMCWIPPGEFLMGSPVDELGRTSDEMQHRVKITRGFWIGKYPVTQFQWEAVIGHNPSEFEGADHPVERVPWNDISGAGGFFDRVHYFTKDEDVFSLPTEAQWEYACRAGTSTALNNGTNLSTEWGSCHNLDEVAWYDGMVALHSSIATHPVGQKKPNRWGVHDMHGNVGEWCVDWYGMYPTEMVIDPQGPNSGTAKVGRGGAWNSHAGGCRSADRCYGLAPTVSQNDLGFRAIRTSIP